ncbi:MAG: protein translocase subunit SecF [Zoogloeaceae bacterium]|jgi:preprotein translocase subunit SecF|nr:protein translocase subunit SecF [Zoogloeaceae bacterium]
MEFFRIKKDIPVMRHAAVFNAVSLIIFVLAVFFLATRGLNFSVEFTGGTLVEVHYQDSAPLAEIRAVLEKADYSDAPVQNFGSSQDVLIRLPLKPRAAASGAGTADAGAADARTADAGAESARAAFDAARQGEMTLAILQPTAVPPPELRRVEFVGPQVGEELAENGALALLVVVVGIMVYLAFRFEWRFSVSTIIANLHDVVIILGFFSFFQWEFSLSVLAAVLAVLGYSVNESVVVFDRVRETFRKKRGLTTAQVLDHAITSTMSRTVITHGSTQAVVLSMLIFGGETLHNFALALTIGICFGIYSSILVASPIVMWLGVSREQFIKPVKAKDPTMTADGACV